MSSWALFLLITFVLGIVVSNIMLLKHSAKMKLPKEVMQAIEERKKKEAEKKPTEK
mgnify:CR=1 FL=1